MMPTLFSRSWIAVATMAVFVGAPGLTPVHGQSAGRPVATIDSGHVSQHLAFAPNGRWLASVGDDFTLKIWDAASGKMIRSIAAHADKINTLRITADGKRIITVSDDKTVKIWNAETGDQLRSLSHEYKPKGVGITAKGELITLELGNLRRWDTETGRLLGSAKAESSDFLPPGHPAFSPDGRLVALEYGSTNGRARVAVLEAATGRVVKAFTWNPKDGYNPVSELAFSPDGRILVAACSDDKLRIWEVASGRLLRNISVENPPADFAFSPDGRRLYSSGPYEHNAVSVWDVAGGTLLKKIQPFDNQYAEPAIALSPDGRQLAMGYWEIHLMDADSGATLGRMQGMVLEVLSVYPAPGNRWFSKSGEALQLWDAETGQPVQKSKTDSGGRLAAPGPDAQGHWIHAFAQNGLLAIWDAVTGQPAELQINERMEGTLLGGISSDGRLLATWDTNGHWNVWDMSAGKRLWSLEHDANGRSAGISPDNKWLATTVKDGQGGLKVWDLSSGRLARTIRDEGYYERASYSPDGRLIAVWDQQFRMFDAVSGRRLWEIEWPDHPIGKQPVFSPDSRLIATADESSDVTLWEAASGRTVRTLAGNPGTPSSIVFIESGQRVVVGNTNGTSTVWATDSGELLATTVAAHSGEWLTITPEGFFAASEHGAEALHIVRGFEVTGIEQVYQSLYRPDLVREKLAGDPRSLVREAASALDLNKVIASGTAPEVRLSLPGRALGATNVDASNVSVEAEITDRGGGIGRVEWRVNGVTAGIDTPTSAGAGQAARLARGLALDPGNNDITVVAYNGANLIASVPARLNVTAQPAVPPIAPAPVPNAAPSQAPVAAAKPRLFALVAGVNSYVEKRIAQLKLAVPDAQAVAEGLKKAAGDLYQSVEVKLMTDAAVTRDKLDAAFAEMAGKMSPSDVFVLYLAGHGKTVDGRYYFIPQDFAVDGAVTDKSIDISAKARGIAQDQWQRWFASIPARKSVILFDTCESGTLAGDETQQLEKGAANDRLAQATGRSILAASSGTQEAIEGYHGHGLFTYEVLDAIDQADGDRSGTIELNELAAYVYAEVSELSVEEFGQRQVPQMKLTANYPLTKQTRILEDAPRPVAEARPTYQVSQAAELQIQPGPGRGVVRSLSAKTAVTVLESKDGWSLIAAEGKPIGYVATRDLATVQ
jgi:WD40 repeat protein/uncharacterized caspase-like protein